MYFIVHHVLESLVIRRTKEDLSIQFTACVTIVKYLVKIDTEDHKKFDESQNF